MSPRREDRVEPPAVVLHHAPGAPSAVLREVSAGAEEEGVPLRLQRVPDGAAVALGHAAARDSRLSVGVGVSADGAVAVHHAQLPADRPALAVRDGTPADWRRAGRTAARVVTGLPLQ
ncbi:glycerol dehydratase reactivase beta/small subunit family protein [Modestobacter sp. Leaf380]|uniref:glycerol dehydratase reactivase beta/small subunit family protein n=1 Tax=Modestobacter sp. Leaf380 TaxID=1736356 RepID=UPI0009EBA267|nr:glycerol dehydratase reactivase beta/small subunit family protein [Modestobacter sp. Leaf380]